ncbi:hypothetical protein PCE1_000345 [Barthelona sp. PCE]
MVVATFETMYSLRDTPDLGKLKKSFHLSGIVLPVLLASWVHTVDEIPLLNHNEPSPSGFGTEAAARAAKGSSTRYSSSLWACPQRRPPLG